MTFRMLLADGPLAGATVTLVNPATNEKQETLTNTAGEYVFSLVRPATYNISAVFKARIYLTPERI